MNSSQLNNIELLQLHKSQTMKLPPFFIDTDNL